MGICYMTSKRSYIINLYELISSLYVVKKGDIRKMFPIMDSPIIFMANTMVQAATQYSLTSII